MPPVSSEEKSSVCGYKHVLSIFFFVVNGFIKEAKEHRTLLLLLFLLLLFKFRLPLLLKFTLQALLLLYSELDQKTLLSVLSLQDTARRQLPVDSPFLINRLSPASRNRPDSRQQNVSCLYFLFSLFAFPFSLYCFHPVPCLPILSMTRANPAYCLSVMTCCSTQTRNSICSIRYLSRNSVITATFS